MEVLAFEGLKYIISNLQMKALQPIKYTKVFCGHISDTFSARIYIYLEIISITNNIKL